MLVKRLGVEDGGLASTYPPVSDVSSAGVIGAEGPDVLSVNATEKRLRSDSVLVRGCFGRLGLGMSNEWGRAGWVTSRVFPGAIGGREVVCCNEVCSGG